mmetsp:Transcript_80044/g.151182  ORF Transcript_80044/g.151182 Transcript_80044/m.151182 type:complete len:873 (-) Transcript_80044:36-2654(-)
MVKWDVDYSKFEAMEDPEPASELADFPQYDKDAIINASYEAEMVRNKPADKLRDMKIKMAMDAYERRRPKDSSMHHYVIKDAGDIDAIGEYVQTGDMRNSCPVYKNSKGVSLSREKQPTSGSNTAEQYGWILGNIEERRPLYGVMTDDLSVPTLGWQSFTALEPVPTIRYYTASSAARTYNESGKRAFADKKYSEAEALYTKALDCKMDAVDYAEPMGMLLSNRAEVRIRMLNYDGAAEDADMALKHLKSVVSEETATKLLKQKTFVRRAKALAGLKRFFEAENVIKEARFQFPYSEEIEQAHKEMAIALKGDSRLGFLSQCVESIQGQVSSLGPKLVDYVFPAALAKELLKVEYLFTKAAECEGEVLTELQMLLRTNGGLRMLLHLLGLQYKSNMEGKCVDLYKMESVSSLVKIICLACEGSLDNMKMAVSQAPALFAALGGCNRKVDADLCSSLVTLASSLLEVAKASTIEAVGSSSAVVEKAAGFLVKAALAEEGDDASGPDAPALDVTVKEKAQLLLMDLFAVGGRIEKRAVRGVTPSLASFDGTGLFTSDEAPVRQVGELVVKQVIAEPSMMSATDVTNFLFGAQLLITAGPISDARDSAIAALPGTSMKYVDLQTWEGSDDATAAASLLMAVGKSLEYRLLLASHQLEKEEYEAAFLTGNGLYACLPLVQAPAKFAAPAALVLAVMCQADAKYASELAGLKVLEAIFGFPSSGPVPSYMSASLSSSSAVRKSVAKIVASCAETEVFLDMLKVDGEKVMGALSSLVFKISFDGKASLEALQDMLNTFYRIAVKSPGPLVQYASVDLLTMLVDLSVVKGDDVSKFFAGEIIKVLKLNRKCSKLLAPILSRAEEGTGLDAEDELLTLAS